VAVGCSDLFGREGRHCKEGQNIFDASVVACFLGHTAKYENSYLHGCYAVLWVRNTGANTQTSTIGRPKLP
jgi:hypothetical protein